jgi:CPA1 family monovalent cation:H+ antiporter
MMHRYRHRLAAVSGGGEGDEDGMGGETYSRLREISARALQVERQKLIELRDRGRISDDVLRTMERELDLEESRYQGMPIA